MSIENHKPSHFISQGIFGEYRFISIAGEVSMNLNISIDGDFYTGSFSDPELMIATKSGSHRATPIPPSLMTRRKDTEDTLTVSITFGECRLEGLTLRRRVNLGDENLTPCKRLVENETGPDLKRHRGIAR
jgi:hypothetical protein